MKNTNSFGSRATLAVGGAKYPIYRLDALKSVSGSVSDRLPFSLKILLENLLRNEDDAFVKKADIEAMARWDVKGKLEKEIALRTARVPHSSSTPRRSSSGTSSVTSSSAGARRRSRISASCRPAPASATR